MTVLILGSPKSGTSVTAGIVHRLGVSMGPDLRLPDARNPRGYFEDVEWNELHDDMLAAAGGGPWTLPSMDALDQIAPAFEDRIATLIASRDAAQEPWGVKVGPSVLRYVVPAVRDPRFVMVARNPLDTARSAVNHTESRPDRLDLLGGLAHGAETFARCVDAAESRPDAPLHVVRYEALTASPESEIFELAAFLGVDDADAVAHAATLVASSDRITEEKAAVAAAEEPGLVDNLADHGRSVVRKLVGWTR